MLRSKEFWKYALIRAIKTICQSAVASIGTSIALADVDWLRVASVSLLSGVLSILTSLGGIPEVSEEEDEN